MIPLIDLVCRMVRFARFLGLTNKNARVLDMILSAFSFLGSRCCNWVWDKQDILLPSWSCAMMPYSACWGHQEVDFDAQNQIRATFLPPT